MDEEVTSGSDNIVTEFNTYEDFLDSQITSLDLYYLEVRNNTRSKLRHNVLCQTECLVFCYAGIAVFP